MCTFIYHDLQLLVIDLSVIQIRTRLLLMTMIGTVLLISQVADHRNLAIKEV